MDTRIQRFASKIHIETSGCWRWLGRISTRGYGRFGMSEYAHRFSYTLFVGPVPDGLVLDHLCRNRWCVNPEHLEAVTSRENIERGNKAGRPPKTHCIRGHAFTPENTRMANTRRWTQQVCLACRRIRDRQYRAQKSTSTQVPFHLIRG
jgi:hypothetical protein